jgi:hypothetical protein
MFNTYVYLTSSHNLCLAVSQRGSRDLDSSWWRLEKDVLAAGSTDARVFWVNRDPGSLHEQPALYELTLELTSAKSARLLCGVSLYLHYLPIIDGGCYIWAAYTNSDPVPQQNYMIGDREVRTYTWQGWGNIPYILQLQFRQTSGTDDLYIKLT